MRWDGGEVKDNNAVYVLPHGTMKFSNLFNINISYDEVLQQYICVYTGGKIDKYERSMREELKGKNRWADGSE